MINPTATYDEGTTSLSIWTFWCVSLCVVWETRRLCVPRHIPWRAQTLPFFWWSTDNSNWKLVGSHARIAFPVGQTERA